MSSWTKRASVAGLMLLAGGQLFAESSAPANISHSVESAAAAVRPTYGYGRPISEQELRSWDIDIGPDGAGLPPGRGTADEGEPIFQAQCAACHGEFGEGMGRYPALIGTRDSLVEDRPSKSVGGYWPYSTTLWDYINRAMPFGNAQSLSADQVYAVTAYILAMNDIIDSDVEINAENLARIRMPNRDGFIPASGRDLFARACMKGCKESVGIVTRASESGLSQ